MLLLLLPLPWREDDTPGAPPPAAAVVVVVLSAAASASSAAAQAGARRSDPPLTSASSAWASPPVAHTQQPQARSARASTWRTTAHGSTSSTRLPRSSGRGAASPLSLATHSAANCCCCCCGGDAIFVAAAAAAEVVPDRPLLLDSNETPPRAARGELTARWCSAAGHGAVYWVAAPPPRVAPAVGPKEGLPGSSPGVSAAAAGPSAGERTFSSAGVSACAQNTHCFG